MIASKVATGGWKANRQVIGRWQHKPNEMGTRGLSDHKPTTGAQRLETNDSESTAARAVASGSPLPLSPPAWR